ncbi:Rv1733c family protein [Streptomyces cinereospinus]|uniref:Membrane protein/MT1774 n=1 Tax=Streptomyces cinereospinus TaxID=285561 RepID=A0ABV5N8W4_9ACTN
MSARKLPHASGPVPPHRKHVPNGANPLRRTSDRCESWFRALLMLVLVLGLPVAALSAGPAAYESSMRTVRIQSAERQQADARVASITERVGEATKRQARVHWADDRGTERTGTTLVERDTPEGATVRVWVTGDGAVTSPPMTQPQAVTTGWFAGGAAATAVAAGVFAARAGVRHVLDRRRFAQWGAEWEQVEPLWAGRFRR